MYVNLIQVVCSTKYVNNGKYTLNVTKVKGDYRIYLIPSH